MRATIVIKGRIGVDAEGTILAFDIDDLTGIGPYSVYPRTSAVEGNQVVNLCGGPYDFAHYRCTTTVVLQNKVPTCQYRAVGHPIATAVTEGLVDMAARCDRHGPDRDAPAQPDARRRLSLHLAGRHEVRGAVAPRVAGQAAGDDAARSHPRRAGGAARARASIAASAFASLHRTDQPLALHVRHRRRAHLGAGWLHGADGPGRIGGGGLRRDRAGAGDRDDPRARSSRTASAWRSSKVRVVTGDTQNTPYGGGTWACRGAGIGGEAALQSALALKDQILQVAGAMLQAAPATLDIVLGEVVDKATGAPRMPPRRARPHRLFPRRHAAQGPAARIRPDAPLHHQGLSLRLHQRHPGLLGRGRCRRPAWSSC